MVAIRERSSYLKEAMFWKSYKSLRRWFQMLSLDFLILAMRTLVQFSSVFLRNGTHLLMSLKQVTYAMGINLLFVKGNSPK